MKNLSTIKKMWLIFGCFWGFVFLVFVSISIGLFGFMPSFEELENPKSNLATEILSDDGHILGTYYVENRTNADYNSLSPYLVQALVATEDARYYSHSGIDAIAIGRVLGKTILGRQSSSGGGSTISQQLAKNLFPRKRQNKISVAFRKLKEWVIAVKLERNYSKEEIIAMYLNTVDFGNNSFGIKTASNTYFGKNPNELNIEESAMLIGMLKATSLYNPVRKPENALRRREVVLNQMRKANYLTDEQYDSLREKPLDMSHFRPQDHKAGIATYLREYLRSWLETWCNDHRKTDGTPYNIYKDGLKIYTTIDSRMQVYAEEAVAEHLGGELQAAFYKNLKGTKNAPFVNMTDEDSQRLLEQAMKNSDRYRNMRSEGYSHARILEEFKKPVEMRVFSWAGEKDTIMSPWDSLLYHKWFLHCGLMSVEPSTGHVKAYVGGIDYRYFQFDNVIKSRRQTGSTFKPFVYALAMQSGEYFPCTELPNVRVCVEQPGLEDWCPKNSDTKREGEMVTLKWALANSINYISAYMIKRFPPQAVINLVRKMGVEGPLEAVPSICLGTCDLSVSEMTGAMSTFVNQGIYNKPIIVTRIEDKNGVVLEQFTTEQNEAMDARTAYLVTRLMQGVVDGGTGGRIRFRYNITAPVAGKTGTTQKNSDGWFMGLTPDLVTGVWVGGEMRSIHFRSTALGQGANMALPIWGLYMKKIYADPILKFPVRDFTPAPGVSVEFDCNKFKETPDGQTFTDEL